jgi:hypothetical protein
VECFQGDILTNVSKRPSKTAFSSLNSGSAAPSLHAFILSLYFSFFEIRCHYVAQAGLELGIFLPQPPSQVLRLKVCDSMPSYAFVLCNGIPGVIH